MDKYKNAGDFLRSIRKIDSLIKRKTEQIERLRSIAIYSRPQPDPNGGGRSNVKGDIKGDLICKIADMEESIKEDMNELLENRLKAMQMIDSLDNASMIDILYLRYLEFKQWDEIAYEVDKSLQWIFELNRKALRILNNNFKSL